MDGAPAIRQGPALHEAWAMVVPYRDGRFPPRSIDWTALVPLIGPANAAVARFEGLVYANPNPDVLLSPLTSQETVLSSRTDFAVSSGIPQQTALRILRVARDAGLLHDLFPARGRRAALLMFSELLAVADNGPPTSRDPGRNDAV